MTLRRPLTREATRAVAHPLRMRILASLDDQSLTIDQLATKLNTDKRTVTRHVRTLERLGLLDRVPSGGQAPAFKVILGPYYTDEAWGELPAPAKRASMAGALLHAHSIASAAAAEGSFDRDDMHYSRVSLVVDPDGWKSLSRAFEALFEQIEAIERTSAERLGAPGVERINVGAIMMLFERMQSSALSDLEACPSADDGLDQAYELSEALDRALIGDRPDWEAIEDMGLKVERLGHQLRVLARDSRAAQERGPEVPA